MDYLCAYDWQQTQEAATLVLKQLEFQGGLSVVFGCMSQEKSFVERITEWFYEKGLSLCRKGEGEVERLESSLLRMLSSISCQTDTAVVLLCVGRSFVFWRKGISVWLLNCRFGRNHYRSLFGGNTVQRGMRNIGERSGGESITGILEPGIGILAATEDFFNNLTGEQIANCLAVKELNQEIKLQKRLGELSQEAKRKGAKHPTAMLIVTCQKE